MNFIIFAATFYTLILVGMYLLQTKLVYPGSETRAKPELYGGAGIQEITLTTSDGIELTHWYQAAKNPSYPVIVAFHGNAGHTGDRLEKLSYLTELGYGLFQVEYRGYAGHAGIPSEQAFKSDGLDAMNWLKDQGYTDEQLIMYGESLGTGMAVWLASKHNVKAVILEAPYSSIADVAQSKYWFLPARFLLKDKWKSHEAIKDVKAPVFIFHGEKDGVIPVQFSRKLLKAIPGQKQAAFFEKGFHMDLYEHGAEKDVTAFLNKYVMPTMEKVGAE
ncbi:alpha/beta hydrolase [Kiloniella spongiae]|uniref:alpha/beta hydrolase n=1 Tax=Kiloniella spongiae TaxID=1489064 RepID=UPI00069BD482|nr:alpha/beta fold hydrolase [Kiloniella spongiae]